MAERLHIRLDVEEDKCHTSEQHLAEILRLVPVRLDERKVSVEITSCAYSFEFNASLFLSLLDTETQKNMLFD